jgi:hypothetical protein
LLKFVSKSPKVARLAVGMTTLVALAVSSGAGYKMCAWFPPINPFS